MKCHLQKSIIQLLKSPIMIMRVFIALTVTLWVIISGVRSDCWWTGCQKDSWATTGCAQYGRQTQATQPCDGGKKYQCCSGTTSSGGGSSSSITQDQFNQACQTKGGSGGTDLYNAFINSLGAAQISKEIEAAKYLAHTVWESAGMTQMREMYCQNSANDQACRNAYGTGPGGVIYYGRGPMQLSHDYNYRAASQSIFGDPNVLLNDPDRVARDPRTGWNTAAYFWSANVHANSQTFGSTLKAINGALECSGGPNAQDMWLRCDKYRDILNILGIPLPDRNSDCYC